MEATTFPSALQPVLGPVAAVRRALGRWGLLVALALGPVFYGVKDLTTGYKGYVNGHTVVHHDLSYLGGNLIQGISTGSIWALIAIGYTLVYGIIELINFAHGDVFMIGSFTGSAFWASIGLGLTTGPLGLLAGPILPLFLSILACGALPLPLQPFALQPPPNPPQ